MDVVSSHWLYHYHEVRDVIISSLGPGGLMTGALALTSMTLRCTLSALLMSVRARWVWTKAAKGPDGARWYWYRPLGGIPAISEYIKVP